MTEDEDIGGPPEGWSLLGWMNFCGFQERTDMSEIDYWWKRIGIAEDAGQPLKVTPWQYNEIRKIDSGHGYPVVEESFIGGKPRRAAFGVEVVVRDPRKPWPEAEDA